MQAFNNMLQWLQFATWLVLGIAAANVWRKRRDDSARWLALTFATLAGVVVVGRLMPQDDPGSIPIVLVKVLVIGIALFPYFLHRFVLSFGKTRRWETSTVNGLTAAVAIATILIPRFPQPNEPRSGWFYAFVLAFVAQWTFILVRVTWRLARAAKTQPVVARRRMYTMSIGAAGFAATLVLSAAQPNADAQHATVITIISGVIALCAGPFFLLGFAPPRIFRMIWRRDEDVAMRAMEIKLAGSLSRTEIAEAFVPRVAELLGGKGAALMDSTGTIVGSYKLSWNDVAAMLHALPADAKTYVPIDIGQARALRMEHGWLLVAISEFTPFFGTDELQMFAGSAVICDLALGRAEAFESERQSRDAMRDFVAIASHDLRTPVTVIQGFTQLMGSRWDELPDEQRRHFIDAIDRQIVHLDRLISDLLTVSKLDVGEVGVFAERVGLRSVVREAVHSVEGDVPIAVFADSDPVVFADPEHIARMVQNYIKNAVVYGGAPITVTIEACEDNAQIRVRDEGPGIPESFRNRLFEKFARADKKKSKAARGTGLGLSIVRGLARANGGDAWYEPNTPHGACFAIQLPLAAAMKEEPVHA